MRTIFLVVLWLCAVSSLQAQDIQSTLQKVEQKSLNNPQEKLYLHLDKFSYTAGENIWFKAYTTIGVNNLFSGLSGIAYVELIDPSQKTISAIKIPLVLGLGIGDFTLNDTITEGSYRIRAYTNWMRNYDQHYFYDRTIQISNGRSDNVSTSTLVSGDAKENTYSITLKGLDGIPVRDTRVRYEILRDGKVLDNKRGNTDNEGVLQVKLDKKHEGAYIKLRFENAEKFTVNKLIKAIAPSMQNSVQLFPEGGKLLDNVVNTIAVKATNPKGLGVKAKVSFLNNMDTVALVETNALGMGAAPVFVDAQAAIKVIAEFEDGTKTEIPFPAIQRSGYTITVNNFNPNKLFTQLNASQDKVNNTDVYIVIHHVGQVLYVGKQKLSKAELFFSTDKAQLPNGVLTVTILNDAMLPIAERAFFNFSPHNTLPIKATLDKAKYKTREKVSVALQTGYAVDDTLKIAALSASVIDLGRIKEDYKEEPTIVSTLLLSSDLKGFIENPGYYFDREESRAQELDYLMLTQGWRNIDWQHLESDSLPKYKPEKGITVSGYTRKFGRKAAEPNAKIQLISTQNFMDFVDTVSAEDGYFEFGDLMFPDSVKLFVSARTEKGSNRVDIVENKFEQPALDSNRNAALEIGNVNAAFADQIKLTKQYFGQLENAGLMEKSIMIDEVVIRVQQKPKVPENSRNLNGPGNADQIITAEQLETCPTLEMCLMGRVMGVTFQNGVPMNTRGNGPMQIVLDGMYIESDQLGMINVMDIASVEVLRNINYTAIYGSYGGNGLLVITSKTGSSALNRPFVPKGILTIQPKGIHINKAFYRPSYEVDNTTKLRVDLRTTIHWEPSIVAGKDGRTNFEFFTSDGTGKYLMIIEGIDLKGRIGREVVELEVAK